jgi:glutamine amidotransferase
LRKHFPGNCPPTWRQVAPVLAGLTQGIAQHGTFNYLLSNGEAMFAHCSNKLSWLSRQHPFSTAKLVDCDISLDLSRDNRPGDEMVVIATEPLTRDEPWSSFEPGELKVFVDGVAAWSSVTGAVVSRGDASGG